MRLRKCLFGLALVVADIGLIAAIAALWHWSPAATAFLAWPLVFAVALLLGGIAEWAGMFVE